MKANWAERKVLESAGVDPDTADDWQIYLASACLTDCYYIDRAADAYLTRVRKPAWQVTR